MTRRARGARATLAAPPATEIQPARTCSTIPRPLLNSLCDTVVALADLRPRVLAAGRDDPISARLNEDAGLLTAAFSKDLDRAIRWMRTVQLDTPQKVEVEAALLHLADRIEATDRDCGWDAIPAAGARLRAAVDAIPVPSLALLAALESCVPAPWWPTATEAPATAVQTCEEVVQNYLSDSQGQNIAEVVQATGSLFELRGSVWHVYYRDGGENGDFKDRHDSVLRHLARLLAAPNRRFRALEFYPPPAGAAPLPHLGRDDRSDGRALKEYEKEMTRLTEDIKKASAAGKTCEVARLQTQFYTLADHVSEEQSARSRGHKKRCGALAQAERADQALRVGLRRAKRSLRRCGLPKLASHLQQYLDNSGGEWWYAPPPGHFAWQVVCPAHLPRISGDRAPGAR